jgi:16S rRNA (cytidine1402-2'-O)-methyltransferase
MRIQKSFYTSGGTLYIVGTPIGNLSDISSRAIEILKQVDVIAAEDTRHTRKLLSSFQISKPLISYHQFSKERKEELLIERLQEGESIALVSDAGMPAISDPGEKLVHRTIEEDIPVVPVPGPNAALSALVASGLPSQPFIFVGFLPRTTKKRKDELKKWCNIEATLLFYEAPFRVVEMLRDVLNVCGNRPVVVSREMTKKNEEWMRGNLQEIIVHLENTELKGEFTVVVAPGCPKPEEEWAEEDVFKQITMYIQDGLSKKEAIQKVATQRQLPKNDVYQRYHQYLKDGE